MNSTITARVDDPGRINLRETILGRRADIERIVNALKVPPRNEGQRPLNPAKVAELAINFDLRCMDAISVSNGQDTWEGQHRLNVLHIGYLLFVNPNHYWDQRAAVEPYLSQIKEALGA